MSKTCEPYHVFSSSHQEIGVGLWAYQIIDWVSKNKNRLYSYRRFLQAQVLFELCHVAPSLRRRFHLKT